MSYAAKAAELSRTPVELLVLTLDRCSNTFGSSPCTATGTACYNTYRTCRDWSNFTKATKDHRFTSAKVPVPFRTGELPYLQSAEYLATEIKDSITVNSRIKAVLLDEPWPDVGTDPYLSTRASAPTGTFWRMLLARNPNYMGRPAALYRGFVGLTEAEFEQRFVGTIKTITYQKGQATVELVDLLKGLDDIQVPAKVDLELVTDVLVGDTTITLSNSTAAGLSVSGGVLRVDDELITYTALSTTTNVISGLTRGAFGTTAEEHDAETSVQPCRYYAPDNPFDHLLDMLETDAGIDSSYIDTAAFTACKATPGDEIDFSTVVSEPTDLSTLFWEIVELLDCKVWIDEDLKITITHNMANSPGRVYTALADATNIVQGSASLDGNDAARKTRCTIYWGWDLIAELEKSGSHSKRSIAVDAEAEGDNEYDDVQEKTIFTRWIRPDYLTDEEIRYGVNDLAARYVMHRRDAPTLLTCKLEHKDYALKVGDYAKLTTQQICGVDGNTAEDVTHMIVKKQYSADGTIEIKAMRLPRRRVCIIAPDSMAGVDYATATDAQREYGAICDENGEMSNEDIGYMIY